MSARTKNKIDNKYIRNYDIAQDYLKGKSYRALAKQYGLSPARIGKILHKPEIQQVLNIGMSQLISAVPLAVDNYIALMRGDDMSLRHKSSRDLLQMVGIMPSHAPSTVINNILTVTANAVLDPRVESAIGGALDSLEVDFEVVESGESGEGGDNGAD